MIAKFCSHFPFWLLFFFVPISRIRLFFTRFNFADWKKLFFLHPQMTSDSPKNTPIFSQQWEILSLMSFIITFLLCECLSGVLFNYNHNCIFAHTSHSCHTFLIDCGRELEDFVTDNKHQCFIQLFGQLRHSRWDLFSYKWNLLFPPCGTFLSAKFASQTGTLRSNI